MTWQDLLIDVLVDAKRGSAQTLRDFLGIMISSSSLYYSLRRLEERKVVSVDRTGYRNIYTYSPKYQRFVYTIRVVETKTVKAKHRWGANGEQVTATVEGIVPIGTSADTIRKVHKERLFDEMLNILSDKDPPVLAIPTRLIKIEDMASKGVSGVEFKEIVDKFDKQLDVEVEFINSQGHLYNKRDGFGGSYQTKLDEYL